MHSSRMHIPSTCYHTGRVSVQGVSLTETPPPPDRDAPDRDPPGHVTVMHAGTENPPPTWTNTCETITVVSCDHIMHDIVHGHFGKLQE